MVTYGSTSENLITFIEFLVGLAITIWGSYSIFKANSSGDGQDFSKDILLFHGLLALEY